MEYRYEPQGVCSSEMIIEIDNNIIKSIKVINGCEGNLKGISSLLIGMNIDDATIMADYRSMKVLCEEIDSSEKAGIVAGQEPRPGKKFKTVRI